MTTRMLTTLHRNREDLLREYMISRGIEKAEVLARILEIDEQIEEEKKKEEMPG